MNYKLILIIVSFAISSIAENAETLNLFGSIGLGFGTGGELFPSVTTDQYGAITKEQNSYFNYGQGLKFDLGAQYYLMQNVALQAGIGFSGRIPRFKLENSQTSSLGTDTTVSTAYRTGLFGIKVLLVPKFEVLELTNMYVGVGTGLFWNSLRYETSKQTATSTEQENGIIHCSPKIGLCGLLGVDYPISDLICAYGEIAFEQMSFTWDKMIIQKSDFRQVGTINYEKDAPNQPDPLRIPGSNWQIRFGVRYAIM